MKKTNTNIKFKEKYLLAYILDPNPEIGNRLEKLSTVRNIKIIIVLDHLPIIWTKNKKNLSLTGKGNIELKGIINITEWLWLFNNSKAVFTDSYHGTIFSIIFRKPFITLSNKKRGKERFHSLLQPLQLIDRLFETPDCINNKFILFEKINFTNTIKHLSRVKMYSYEWLKNKLKII